MQRNVWCAARCKDETGKVFAGVVPIRIGTEIFIPSYKGYEVIRPCETQKEARAIVNCWRELYRQQDKENEQVN